MTDEQRAELKRLAEAARGVVESEWKCGGGHSGEVRTNRGILVAMTQALETGRFIAAANPVAVLDLLKEHEEDQGVIAVWRSRTERAEAEAERLRAALKLSARTARINGPCWCVTPFGCPDEHESRCAQIKAALEDT